MENLYNDNEFEQFLKDETKQHRMYPSDKIWRNIHQELHPKKAWPALTIFGLFIISALTISTILNNHPAEPTLNISKPPTATNETVSANKNISYQEQLFSNNITTRTLTLLKEKAREEEMAAYEDWLSEESPLVATVPNIAKSEVVLYEPHIIDANKASENIDKLIAVGNKNIEKEIKRRLMDNAPSSSIAVNNINKESGAQEVVAVQRNNKLSIASLQDRIKTRSLFKKSIDDNPAFEEGNIYQLPSLLSKQGPSKLDFQVYITPSISYRKLVDDKERNNYSGRTSPTSGPTALNYNVNVNDVVRHKPAMGTEVGLGVMYRLTKRLKLKSGIQFNIRQYYIDGYSTNTKLATIAIVSNNKLDTITQYSSFSNTNGYKESQLDNKLYQISMPVGLQWDFFQRRHLGFSVGGSIQPTLTLNKNLYIISTDYKLYTDGTPFLRRWNVNSSAELNITYKVGATKWYFGPQVRYQHLPTYTEKYPIKEYRLDYGLKIGFTKSL